MNSAFAGSPVDAGVMIAYFMAVTGFGLYFGKYASTTSDFYFGGRRFAWWLIAFSGIATTVGSYSFVKYSAAGYSYGISSSQTYLNDWFWVPILIFIWLPIIYYQRIQSVPEFFERRFSKGARACATLFILLYLIGYVAYNFLTLGTALQSILGWDVYVGALVACLIVTLYVMAGGQTSVIMTDLVQGITLLLVGMGLFFYGVWYMGGFGPFWGWLPESHRHIFSEFNRPDQFSFIGIYAQDGLANTGAFVLMNQGMMMRFLSMRSMGDARKMVVCWILVLAPLAAITVSGSGWIGRALVDSGMMPEFAATDAFVAAAHFLCSPGMYGLVLAALMAALMSTADTLINATSAVFLNDIYRPYIKPNRDDRHYLRVARATSLATALLGLMLVPMFVGTTLYQAHAKFTAAVTPPIVMAILLGVLWPRFNTPAAIATLVGGLALTLLSFVYDSLLLSPFAFGMGPKSFDFIRALFGLVVSGGIGVTVALLTKPQDRERIRGLVNGTQLDAMRQFKGADLNRKPGAVSYLQVFTDATITDDEICRVPARAMETMAAQPGDLAYVCDRRWWYGGLRSVHGKFGAPADGDHVLLSPGAMRRGHFKDGEAVWAEKLF
jgi:SSS family solute:Na+ symporter